MAMADDIEFEEEFSEALETDSSARFSEAVVFSSDWTVETILSQLGRGKIQLNPNFQRREAWSTGRKSKFIETIIVGLPSPQLVLAEVQGHRGNYIVLDGKQRLLSLLRFTESEENKSKGFGLSSLEIRTDLQGKKYHHFIKDILFEQDKDAFLSYTIRTVVIRNWPNNDFLHQVFLRLNTGSVTLSSQELRQAIAPGEFTTFADEFAASSRVIQSLLGRNTPDPRMRDVELLVRHIAFRDRLVEYRGRMKKFLDETCVFENKHWTTREERIVQISKEFEDAIELLRKIFGQEIARKPESRSFNRAIFDALSYYAAIPELRVEMERSLEGIQGAYNNVFQQREFQEAIESDTAGLSNTVTRLQVWGEKVSQVIGIRVNVPQLHDGRIIFEEG
jgi:hypothetical protein